jgi:hypothetical protein
MLGTEEHLKHMQSQSAVIRYLRYILDAASLDLQFNIESQYNPTATWTIRFSGPDVHLLTESDSKLLGALAHLIVENFGFSEVHAELSSIVLGGVPSTTLHSRSA